MFIQTVSREKQGQCILKYTMMVLHRHFRFYNGPVYSHIFFKNQPNSWNCVVLFYLKAF